MKKKMSNDAIAEHLGMNNPDDVTQAAFDKIKLTSDQFQKLEKLADTSE